MNAWLHELYWAPERKPGGGWICFKSSPSAPPPVDYQASATQQGEENRKTSLAQNVMANPNVTNPYGSQQVTYAIDPTTGQLQGNVNQTLNPQLQAQFNQYQGQNQQMLDSAQHPLDRAQAWLGTDFNPIPAVDAYHGSVANAGGIQKSLGDAGPIQRSVGGIDTSGVAKMPVNAGMTGQQAIMSRLAPQIERSNAAYNQQLANQGIALGSEAYKNGQMIQGQNNNDLLSQAALQGINLDMTANNQGFNQGLASANFGVTQGNFANAAQGQQFQQNLDAGNFANSAQNQQYQQNLSDAQFGNQASQYALQGQEFIRTQALNEANAMRSGAQVNVPQFQQYQGAGMTPANYQQAAAQQGQQNTNQYNAQVGQSNAFNSGLFSLGAAGIAAFSDRRLKSNIERVGTHPLGIGIYEYDIFGRRERGVMAQELLHVKPSAVLTHPSGYLMVDYGEI